MKNNALNVLCAKKKKNNKKYEFFKLGAGKFHFLNLRARKFHFTEYEKNFLAENIRKF